MDPKLVILNSRDAVATFIHQTYSLPLPLSAVYETIQGVVDAVLDMEIAHSALLRYMQDTKERYVGFLTTAELFTFTNAIIKLGMSLIDDLSQLQVRSIQHRAAYRFYHFLSDNAVLLKRDIKTTE